MTPLYTSPVRPTQPQHMSLRLVCLLPTPPPGPVEADDDERVLQLGHTRLRRGHVVDKEPTIEGISEVRDKAEGPARSSFFNCILV